MGCSSSSPTGGSQHGQHGQHGQGSRPTGVVNPQQRVQYNPNKTDIEVKQVKIDRAALEYYLELERKIHQSEGRNVLKALKLREDQLGDLEETIKQLQKHYDDCMKNTAKEKADVDNMPSVRNFFKDQAQYDAKMSKEQEEYLEALNQQEIAKKELDGVSRQRDQAAREVASMRNDAQQIQSIYKEQDELLAGIFDGKYGSAEEYKLESELDMLMDRKQRIGVAKYKWQNGRVLLQYATNQLGFAVRRWTDVAKIRPENMQQRYIIATETRNNLIAAHQNIMSAQKYLNTIQFPYCKASEMETLARATNNIYTDMQTGERHTHSLQCYSTTHKRASALLQWFDHVINNTINKDLERAAKEVSIKEKELRSERLRVIKMKIRETMGQDVDLNIDNEMELGEDVDGELETMAAMEADNVSVAGDLPTQVEQKNDETGESSPGEAAAPTPLPVNELAPAPDTQDLFGNIDELKRQHEKEMEEFSKGQEINKARMEQGLEEKLQARRSRRMRQQLQDQQDATSAP